jgi:hypothetical protein
MKVGDMVKVVVPGPNHVRYGLIVESRRIAPTRVHGIQQWWHVLRNDTSQVERFHEKWCEVIDESR